MPDNDDCDFGYFYVTGSGQCEEIPIDNCALWNNEGVCLSCMSGYQLFEEEDEEMICEEIPIEFLDNCDEKISGCDAKFYYHDLNPYIAALYNCQKCSGSDIPFVGVWPTEVNVNSNYIKHKVYFPISTKDQESYSESNSFGNNADNGFFDVCLNPERDFLSKFLMNKFIKNCALGAFNAQSEVISGNYQDNSILCLACMPGYKEIWEDDFLVECEEILGCKKSELRAGACDEPDNDNGYFYRAIIDDVQDGKFDTDILINDGNIDLGCLVVLEEPELDFLGEGNHCFICKDNYQLKLFEDTTRCFEMSSSQCSSESFGAALFIEDVNDDIWFYEYEKITSFFMATWPGCQSCKDNDTRVFLRYSNLCHIYPDLNVHDLICGNIQHCVRQGIMVSTENRSTENRCIECASGYILNSLNECFE